MRSQHNFRLGVMFAIGSAITFGMSGPLAKSLMNAGWSPTAAATARLAGGALVIAVFATLVNRNWLRDALPHSKTIVLYGLVPVAGAQLCFYNAVSHLSVSVALLLEYLSPVLVVSWVWATTGRRPAATTLVGVALALAGYLVVLDVFSGTRVNAIGVAWGLGAMVCSAAYFMLSDRVSADGTGLNSLTLAAGGLIVGATALGVLGISGVMPLTFTANDTVIAGVTTSWVVPVVALALLSTAIAYVLGISGVARLRPSYSSLLGLTEVLCAIVAAWLLLGEKITPTQTVGAAVVLAGLALAGARDSAPAESADRPDDGVVEELAAGQPA